MAKGKAYFISDLHLGAPYLGDVHDAERRVIRFLDAVSDDMTELYLLGDILDYWYEYRYVVPRGFVRFFGKLAQLSDRGVKITWLIGNHDIWIFDYLPYELGIKVVDGVLNTTVLADEEGVGGTRMVMEHGDGVGIKDFKFQIIRHLFRNRVCQKLYAAIHPRWTIPFATGWSRYSRMQESAIPIKEDDRAIHRRIYEKFCNDYSEGCKSRGEEIPKYYLFGHLHRMIRRSLEYDAEMLVIGDWMTHFSYAVWDGEKMEMNQFFSEK